jgi:hypothetical protein
MMPLGEIQISPKRNVCNINKQLFALVPQSSGFK